MAAKLKLVDNSAGGPPRRLGQHGMALYRSICRDYSIDDAFAIEVPCLAAQALDRAEECRAVIDEEGVAAINKDTGAIRENPLCKIELALRAFVAKQLERLGLNSEPALANGRPPASYAKTQVASS
jgi:hypothetical protein